MARFVHRDHNGGLLLMALLSCVAGAATGFVVAMFRVALQHADHWRDAWIARACLWAGWLFAHCSRHRSFDGFGRAAGGALLTIRRRKRYTARGSGSERGIAVCALQSPAGEVLWWMAGDRERSGPGPRRSECTNGRKYRLSCGTEISPESGRSSRASGGVWRSRSSHGISMLRLPALCLCWRS
jgi:hypothetical protein